MIVNAKIYFLHYPVKEIIQAYECAALDASSPYDLLEKATILRLKHDIPKKVLPPLECYSGLKEWETIEELESYRNDNLKLHLLCILARERIITEHSSEVAPSTTVAHGCDIRTWNTEV